MIPEPYICDKGHLSGEIRWFDKQNTRIKTYESDNPFDEASDSIRCLWRLYADLEREKLRELVCWIYLGFDWSPRYDEIDYSDKRAAFKAVFGGGIAQKSIESEGYSAKDWWQDSESNRLLKRAEFLKAVCEKEGVEWLPKSCGCESPNEHCLRCTPVNGEVFYSPSMKERVNLAKPTDKQEDGISFDHGTFYMGESEDNLKEVGQIKSLKIKLKPKHDDSVDPSPSDHYLKREECNCPCHAKPHNGGCCIRCCKHPLGADTNGQGGYWCVFCRQEFIPTCQFAHVTQK